MQHNREKVSIRAEYDPNTKMVQALVRGGNADLCVLLGALLRPFRTFLEVDQPESEFLLRVDAEKGVGLFEADGGVWKLEAKKNIAAYFAKSLSDLIEAGQVVIMC